MKALLPVLFILAFTPVFSQLAPDIQWQKTYGGSKDDQASHIIATSDGGYILVGYTSSNNGDVTGNHGPVNYSDAWIIKINNTGEIQWQKTLGGTKADQADAIKQTPDGGYIIAGSTFSNDGDITGNHGRGSDYWVVKLNSLGDIQWQKTLGGTSDDGASDVNMTSDGGYIVAGYSYSTDGDVTGHHGEDAYSDCWIVKLSTEGAIQWQKSLGGSSDDGAAAVEQTADGGYIVAGSSSSFDGNVTGNHGLNDYWVVKLNRNGAMQWQKSLGGVNNDIAYAIRVTADGGYIVTGWSASGSGDVTMNHGGIDYWVVKLSSGGTIQWQKSLGGSNDDFSYSVQPLASGDYLVGGYTESNNGNVTGYHGGADLWIVKLNSAGNIIWQKSLGGSYYESGISVCIGQPDGYIIAGSSSSNNGDVSGNHGSRDYWVVKLKADSVKHNQAITFSLPPSKKPTDADFALTATASSGLPVTYSSSDTTVATIVAGNKVHIKAVGTTNITAKQNGDSLYYAATPVTQVLTVATQSQQTITFPAIPARLMTDPDYTLTATASSGLTVSYISSDTNVATIVSGNKVHAKSAGTANITAMQPGDTNYFAATPVTRPLTITKATQTISWPDYGSGTRRAADGDFIINATTTSGLPLTIASSDTSIISIINGNTAHVKKTGYVNILITQPGNSVYNQAAHYYGFNLTGTSQTLTITPAPPSGGYSVQLCDIKTVLNAHATSGLPVRYTSSDSSVVDISGDTLLFKKEGIVSLTAVQPGDLNYAPSNTIYTRVKVTGTDTTHYTPAIVVTYSPAINNVCAGETRAVTFSAATNSAGNTPFYQWKKNGVNVGSNSSTYNDPAFKPGTDTLWCVLTSAIKCVTVNNIVSNKISIVPIPVTTPTITVLSYAEQACLNRPVTFKASIKNGGATPLYQWKKNGVDVGTNSSIYIDSTLFNSDTIWCVFTTSAACTTISTPIVSNKVTEEVFYTRPNPPSPIVGLSNVTVNQQRVGYSVNRVLDVTYEWVVPAGATILTGQGTNQIVVNWGSTGGQVTVRARNACGATDRSILNVTVAPAFGIINSINENDELKTTGKAELYPNPAASTAYISFTAPAAGKYLVQLTDAQGRILQTKETNAIKGYNKLSLNVAGYAQGVYFVRLAGNNKQQSLRLLIQR